MRMTPFLLAPLAAGLVLAACSPSGPDAPDPVQPYSDDVELDETAPDAAATENDTDSRDSVVDIAIADPDLSTFLSVLEAADVQDTLISGGPYTVFAPTNEAFAALPEGQLETWLDPENQDQLQRVVQYHVLPGRYMAADAPAEEEGVVTSSLNNLDLAFRRTPDGALMANQATVTTPDIEASNGVVHIVDTVLVPRMSE